MPSTDSSKNHETLDGFEWLNQAPSHLLEYRGRRVVVRPKPILGTWEAEIHLRPDDVDRIPTYYLRPLRFDEEAQTLTIRMCGLPDRTEMDICYLHGSQPVTADSTGETAIDFIKTYLEAYLDSRVCQFP